MELTLLRQADFVLSKCGRPTLPDGLSVIHYPKSFMVQAVVATSSQITVTKEITGDTTWCLRSIQCSVDSAQALYIQIQLPNGRFLINTLMDVTQIAGFGSYRYHFSRELYCPPGSKLQVTFDTSVPEAEESQALVMEFEGAYAFYLRGGAPAGNVETLWSELPRYLATPAQNILAPCWMSGEGPQAPAGFSDERFIYSSPAVAIDATGPGYTAQTKIQIEQSADFEFRRFLVDVTADNTVTAGAFLVRARLGSGYILTDEYVDLARFLGSAFFAKDWHVPAGDSVVLDIILVDAAGTGSLTLQVHLDGVKRRRAA